MNETTHAHQIIAGALFDFLGFLTTREQGVTLGASHLATPAVDLLTEWAAKRQLPLDEAAVLTWREKAVPTPIIRKTSDATTARLTDLDSRGIVILDAPAELETGGSGPVHLQHHHPEVVVLPEPPLAPDEFSTFDGVRVPDGFAVWIGGDIPVQTGTYVEWIIREKRETMQVYGPAFAEDLRWTWRWKGTDIIAYRVVAGGEVSASDADSRPHGREWRRHHGGEEPTHARGIGDIVVRFRDGTESRPRPPHRFGWNWARIDRNHDIVAWRPA